MRFESYNKVLTIKGIKSVLMVCMALKIPIAMAPAVLTLLAVEELGVGFWGGGVVLAVWTVGVAVGAPFQGKFLDKSGVRPVFILVAIAQAAFWGLAPFLSYSLLVVAALFSGGLLVSGSTVARLAISSLVPDENKHTAFAIESMMTNVAYLVGPAVGVLVATQISPSYAVIGTGTILVLGCGLLVFRNPPLGLGLAVDPSETVQPYQKAPIFYVLVCAAAAGAIASGSEIGIIATLRTADQTVWSGLVMSVCAVSSLLGGLAYGSRKKGLPASLLVGVLGAAMIPIGLASDWRVMMLAVIPATMLIAPTFASIAGAMSILAPTSARGSVMSMLGSSMTAGMALGSPLAGATFDAAGSIGCFAAVGGLGIIAAVVSWRPLRSSLRTITSQSSCKLPTESKEEV